MTKIAFFTLGCKVNQYETEAMLEQFKNKNYEIVKNSDFADIYIINTCTVTHLSDKKSRQMIRRAKKLNENALVVAVGCYAQISPGALSEMKEVDLILGNINKNKIIDIIESHDKIKNRVLVYDIYEIDEYEKMEIHEVMEKTRAFVKIQDGCNQYCSYCIIPYARGKIRSRDKESIYREVENLAKKRYKEIVFTGIHIASYGVDNNDIGLFELAEYVHNIVGIKRIRIGSLEQKIIDDKFLTIAPKLDKLCKHFHLSLQSGSDTVLQRMNRNYTSDEYLDKINIIRKILPKASITTDIIVGFPGETEEEFKETMEFVKTVKFSDVHVFKFSKREGTKAAVMQDQIEAKIKSKRSEELINLVNGFRFEFYQQFINEKSDVLFETKEGEFFVGHTNEYIKVKVKTDEELLNEICKVELIESKFDHMIGILI